MKLYEQIQEIFDLFEQYHKDKTYYDRVRDRNGPDMQAVRDALKNYDASYMALWKRLEEVISPDARLIAPVQDLLASQDRIIEKIQVLQERLAERDNPGLSVPNEVCALSSPYVGSPGSHMVAVKAIDKDGGVSAIYGNGHSYAEAYQNAKDARREQGLTYP